MILRNRCQTFQIFLNFVTSEGRIVWLLNIPGILYCVLLIFHALWNYIPDNWNSVYYQPKYPEPPRASPMSEYSSSNLPPDVTVVTAFFDLGTFRKGKFKTFTFDTYTNWIKAYGKLNNSVIMYTDSEEIKQYVIKLRHRLPSEMTQVYIIQRKDTWSFRLAPKIKDIYLQPGYPQHHPNTVNENYSCAMHAKYELLEKVITMKLLKTKYIAWVDIGYFRENEKDYFSLQPPTNFQQDHIGFTQIDYFYPYLKPEKIIKQNYVWIAGGLFLGVPEYLMIFINDYKSTVEDLIQKKLMNTDQQVLYTMYSPQTEYKPRIPLQYFYNLNRLDWFFFGETCREPDAKQVRLRRPIVNYLNVLP